jgi:hypothetical protein
MRRLLGVEEPAGGAEETEDGRWPVAGAEAADEMGVGDDAAPAFADGSGAGEGGGVRRKAEEDLGEDVIVVGQMGRQGGAAASAAAATLHHRSGGILGLFGMWWQFFSELRSPWWSEAYIKLSFLLSH